MRPDLQDLGEAISDFIVGANALRLKDCDATVGPLLRAAGALSSASEVLRNLAEDNERLNRRVAHLEQMLRRLAPLERGLPGGDR